MTSSSLDVQRPSTSPFSPAFSTSRWTYDVFLSFRGEDVRNTFVDRLDNALRQRGIKIYIDDMLRKGDDILPALLKAIKESKISIVVLSKNYASSTWCLEELMKILECMETKQQIVLPVFYQVDPSEVRKQTKSFKKPLANLEKRFRNDIMKVRRWREALTKVANLSGFRWIKKERKESEFIHEIVQWVSRSTVWRKCLYVAKFPIGIESRVQDIISLLSIQSHDVIHMVGIFGIGGIGKTTVAKAVYNAIAYHFDGSCFLGDIQTISKRENGIAHLQETLLYEILEDSTLKVHNEDQGISEIKNRLCFKKVLLILDDVGESKQLEKLVGACDWFGLGSRIIIVTRDKHLLNGHEVGLQYKAQELNRNEALQLFSLNAFHRYKPNDDFVGVTKDVLGYAKGIPLVLTILGSDLYGSDMQQWESALESYKEIPNPDIQETLKISYNRLDDRAKKIFLDIACFFIGVDVEYVITILDNCHFYIKKLIDKCLISVDAKTLRMHDLLRDMGREVVRQESNEPGERSRLWFYKDIRHVLEDNTGTNKVEGMVLALPEPDLIHLSSEVFKKMTRLRLFINRNACFSEGPNFLSNELRVFNWPNCPLQDLPSNFRGEKLVELNMPHSLIKEFKARYFKNLTSMDFTECKFLQEIPDLSSNKNLTRLIVDGCINLVEVHHSVGFLEKLQVLTLLDCSSLSSFPRRLELPSLSELQLSGCLSLQYFPEIGCEMKNLWIIGLARNGTYELPSSFGILKGLAALDLSECENLVSLPNSIFQMPNLSSIQITGCRNLMKIGNELQYNGECSANASAVPSWENRISSAAKSTLPLPLLGLSFIPEYRKSLLNRLVEFGYASRFLKLDLSESDIVRLHASIKRLDGLRELHLDFCEQLQEIVELPPNIIAVYAGGCNSLECFPEVVKRFQFSTSDCKKLNWIDLSGCHKMHLNIENHVPKPDADQSCYGHSWGIVFPGNRIPNCCFSLCEKDIGPNSYKIQMERTDVAKIKGIVVCVVISPVFANFELSTASFFLKGEGFKSVHRPREFDIRGTDYVWLEYLELQPWKRYWDREDEGGACDLLISTITFYKKASFILKKFGAYLVSNNEERAEYHPRMGYDAVHVHGEDIENRGGKRLCITKI